MSNTLRRFDDDAISNIFSVLKANLGQKTDAYKLSYNPNPDNRYSYFVVNTTGGATATNTINAEKIADTLNDLYSLVKINGAITLSNNIYTGTGNAVTASDLATIFTNLLAMINNKQNTLTFDEVPTDGSNNPVKSNGVFDALAEKLDIDKVNNNVLDGTGADTAASYMINMFNDSLSWVDRDAAASSLASMILADEDDSSSSHRKVFFDVATGKTDYLPSATHMAIVTDLANRYVFKLTLKVYSAIQALSSVDSTPTLNSDHLVTSGGVATALSNKVDNSRITTSITAGSTDIPTAGAVASAIAGVGGVSFYKCKTAQETGSTDEFSGNSQTFTGDSHGTPTTGTTETSYPYTLTESPKKINSVTYNGQQIKYEYNATTHIITITLPNPNPPTTTAPSASDTLIVNYVPYPVISGTPQSNTFYLVPNDGTGTDNIYNEYVWINNAWELIGSTENDFSQYVKYEDLDVITVEELTSLFTAATPANVQSGS